MGDVVNHPAATLMAEVEVERTIADTPEAQALQDAILDAVTAYYEHLDRQGLFYDVKSELVRASALHVVCDMLGTVEITLKDGALDRRYGGSEDPDPGDRSPNPT